MLKFCTFCGRKLDTEGFCTNLKCPDYKRKLIIETEKEKNPFMEQIGQMVIVISS